MKSKYQPSEVKNHKQHPGQSNPPHGKILKGWTENKNFWDDLDKNQMVTLHPSQEQKKGKESKMLRKRSSSGLEQITEEQLNQLLKSYGINGSSAFEAPDRFLDPSKSLDPLKRSHRDSFLDNFNDYSHLQHIMGDSAEEIAIRSLKLKIAGNMKHVNEYFVSLRKEISFITNEILKFKSILRELCNEAGLKLAQFFQIEFRRIERKIRQELLELREKQLIQHKLESTVQEQKLQQTQINFLNTQIKRLEHENSQLKSQIQELKQSKGIENRQRYVKTLQNFSTEVEALATEIYEMKHKEIEKEEKLKQWAEELERKQKYLNKQIQRYERQSSKQPRKKRPHKIPLSYFPYEDSNRNSSSQGEEAQQHQGLFKSTGHYYPPPHQYHIIYPPVEQKGHNYPLSNIHHETYRKVDGHNQYLSPNKPPIYHSHLQNPNKQQNHRNLRIEVGDKNHDYYYEFPYEEYHSPLEYLKSSARSHNKVKYRTTEDRIRENSLNHHQNHSKDSRQQNKFRQSFGHKPKKNWSDMASINARLKIIQNTMNQDLRELNIH